MIRTLFTFIFSVLLLTASAQRDFDDRERFKDKLYLGGNFSLQFGNVTFINVSPMVGYRATDKLSFGPGFVYQYWRIRGTNYDYSTSIYGPQFFTRYLITDQIFAQTEYQLLNVEAYDPFENDLYRDWISAWFVGAGYRQRIGSNGFLWASLMYDLIDDPNSPYANRFQPRIGVSFGL